MNDTSYNIHHIDISDGVRRLETDHAHALYLVFFYKSIPLGHVYVNVDTYNASPFDICYKAIEPALLFYQREFQLTEFVLECNEQSMLTLTQLILEKINPPNFPQTSDVSIVICTRNRAESLATCLEALSKQISKPAEIVVVDNASTSVSVKHVCKKFNVRYIREDRVGLDIARNTGAREARHSIIAYTDDDTTPDPLWVYRVHETFARNPEVAAMTGLILAGSLKTEAEIIFEKYWPFNRGFTPRVFDDRFFKSTLPGGPPVWEIGAGANMAFRKTVFDDVGYFDERLDVGAAGCSGDSELWYRILAENLVIQYNPLAIVQHFHRASLDGLKRQLYSYMKGFTVAILIQYQRFGHNGNLRHLFRVIPVYYLSLLRKGFPYYNSQYQTLFSEMRGIIAGMFYYLRHRNTNPRIFIGP
ncbi:MAG TPA: glycosyltransferase [Chryseosolibacter sp.]|nr:glycosyltransferase [Chryseosolibacter sp.]